jgi:uncharacterized membrane protein
MSESPGFRWRRSRWLRIAPILLLLSVAVNLLLIGAFIGRWTMPHHPPPPGPGMMRHMIADMGRSMSDADRAILEQAYQAHAHAMEDRWADHRAAFDAIRHAMAAEPFDRAALEKAMDAAAEQDVAQRGVVEQTLLDAASKMSADGRHRMAGWRPGPPSDGDRR